jgi:hypothetical protein
MVLSVIFLVVVTTSIWVGLDSKSLGAKPGVLGGGFLDMGPVAWFLACLLFWVIAFPCYLVARPRLRAVGSTVLPTTPPGPSSRIVVSSPVASGGGQARALRRPPAAGSSALSELERLHQLRLSGAISDEEFDLLKQRVIQGFGG